MFYQALKLTQQGNDCPRKIQSPTKVCKNALQHKNEARAKERRCSYCYKGVTTEKTRKTKRGCCYGNDLFIFFSLRVKEYFHHPHLVQDENIGVQEEFSLKGKEKYDP